MPFNFPDSGFGICEGLFTEDSVILSVSADDYLLPRQLFKNLKIRKTIFLYFRMKVFSLGKQSITLTSHRILTVVTEIIKYFSSRKRRQDIPGRIVIKGENKERIGNNTHIMYLYRTKQHMQL